MGDGANENTLYIININLYENSTLEVLKSLHERFIDEKDSNISIWNSPIVLKNIKNRKGVYFYMTNPNDKQFLWMRLDEDQSILEDLIEALETPKRDIYRSDIYSKFKQYRENLQLQLPSLSEDLKNKLKTLHDIYITYILPNKNIPPQGFIRSASLVYAKKTETENTTEEDAWDKIESVLTKKNEDFFLSIEVDYMRDLDYSTSKKVLTREISREPKVNPTVEECSDKGKIEQKLNSLLKGCSILNENRNLICIFTRKENQHILDLIILSKNGKILKDSFLMQSALHSQFIELILYILGLRSNIPGRKYQNCWPVPEIVLEDIDEISKCQKVSALNALIERKTNKVQ